MSKIKKGRTVIKTNKRDKKPILIGAIVIFIMVFSVLGFVGYYQSDEDQNYNGQKFTYNNQAYTTKINGEKRIFYFHPSQLEDLNISQVYAKLQDSSVIGITFDPEMEEAYVLDLIRFEWLTQMPKYGKFIEEGVLNASSKYDLPELNCQEGKTIIEFRSSETKNISISGSCITVSGRDTDMIAFKEKVDYLLADIMVN